MLQLVIGSVEFYNERTNEFYSTKEQTLQLEHSLVSLSKWESKWKKAFLSDIPKTTEETIDYIRCMCMTQNVDDQVFNCITNENIREVTKYIEDAMTATTFSKDTNGAASNKKEIITAEIIYYWMITFGIPFECQKWHLNRLLSLIKVCNIKNKTGSSKMSKKDILARNRELNSVRRSRLNSKG